MKILLQSEATTISNDELQANQEDLIELPAKMYRFFFVFPRKVVKNVIS